MSRKIGDRELDVWIAKHAFGMKGVEQRTGENNVCYTRHNGSRKAVPTFTKRADIALSVVETCRGILQFHLTTNVAAFQGIRPGVWVAHFFEDNPYRNVCSAYHPNPALAVCLAVYERVEGKRWVSSKEGVS